MSRMCPQVTVGVFDTTVQNPLQDKPARMNGWLGAIGRYQPRFDRISSARRVSRHPGGSYATGMARLVLMSAFDDSGEDDKQNSIDRNCGFLTHEQRSGADP